MWAAGRSESSQNAIADVDEFTEYHQAKSHFGKIDHVCLANPGRSYAEPTIHNYIIHTLG